MAATRRSFIKYASLAAAGNVAGLHPFGMLNALAQSTTDYKALVCVFLYGGNDGNNMIVPINTTSLDLSNPTANYGTYQQLRGPVALTQGSLLGLNGAPNYGLHPNMPDVQNLFNSNSAAFLLNVGNLFQPMTKKQFLSATDTTLPSSLYSHLDQAQQWQNAAQSVATQTGWGGRIADLLATNPQYSSRYNAGAKIPAITSVFGGPLFAMGDHTSALSVLATTAPDRAGFNVKCDEGAACDARLNATQTLLRLASGVSLVQADMNLAKNLFRYGQALTDMVQAAPAVTTVFRNTSSTSSSTFNPLAAQLLNVAQIIQARSSLGLSRQIFFVELDGFDTHGDQLLQQGKLLAQVSEALGDFYRATQDMGVESQVTTFTISDFSRCLVANTATGTDHAWGSHQLIMGGAVKGGQMYGKFPQLDVSTSGPTYLTNDDNGQGIGRFIPSTSVVQSAATLAQWFGVSQADLAAVFPNIGSFATNNLGFV